MKARTRIPGWLLVAICLPPNLTGAECIEFSQRKSFRHAFAVFRGTAVQVQDLDSDSSSPMLVTFKVDRGWKGPVTETTRVFLFGRPPEGDGYDFRVGERYVVYATNTVPQNWGPLVKVRKEAVVYGIGDMCILRVRADVDRESRKLHWGHRPQACFESKP